MKNKFLVLFTLPLLTTLFACNGQNPSEDVIDNLAAVEKFKALLDKQDLSPFYDKTFNVVFRQNYSQFSTGFGEEEGVYKDFYSYQGSGIAGFGYSIDKDIYDEITSSGYYNTCDLMSQGKGHYELVQAATIHSYVFDNSEEDLTYTEERNHLTLSQQMMADFTLDDFQVANTMNFSSSEDSSMNVSQHFNGKIDKELLFENISTESLTKILGSVNLYDGPGTCEYLDGFYYSICQDLTSKSDKEISNFIKVNQIAMNETTKNVFGTDMDVIELSFVVGDDSIKETLGDHNIIPGTFSGTLDYDKETGEFVQYTYAIKFVEELIDEEAEDIHSASILFEANGYSNRDPYPEDGYIKPDPVIY